MGRGGWSEGAGSRGLAAQIAKVPSQVKRHIGNAMLKLLCIKVVISPFIWRNIPTDTAFLLAVFGWLEKAHRRTWLVGRRWSLDSFLVRCLRVGRSWGWRSCTNFLYNPWVLIASQGCHLNAFYFFSTLLALYVLTILTHHILYYGVSPNALWLPLHIKPSVCYSPSHVLYHFCLV